MPKLVHNYIDLNSHGCLRLVQWSKGQFIFIFGGRGVEENWLVESGTDIPK